MKKRLILCLDGTWNNTYSDKKREDGSKIVKPSNVLKFARAVKPADEYNTNQIVHYDIGVGAMSKFAGPSNRALYHFDKYLGGVWGAGFESNIEDAVTFLSNNFVEGDEIYIFGFSRGAATSRALTNFMQWMHGIPTKRDAYYIPQLLRHYIANKGKDDTIQSVIESISKESELAPFHAAEVDFLGVWDTVLSLGSRIFRIAQRDFHLNQTPSQNVKFARQALAIDERRHDFLPSIWTEPASNKQNLKQMWFAGVHSNVGGGYVYDGLANNALSWMMNEVKECGLGLEFDRDFAKFYRPFPQDLLIESSSIMYRLKDKLLFRSGIRKIFLPSNNRYKNAGLSIHQSVVKRLVSHPLEGNTQAKPRYTRLQKYRPKNLLKSLRQIPNLAEFINNIDNKYSINHICRILAGGDIVFSAKEKMGDTGVDLDYRTVYQVEIIEEIKLKDKNIDCDLSGWNHEYLKKNLRKHNFFKKLSRMREASIFSLIGMIENKKIDLGKKWVESHKKPFTICLADELPDKEVNGRLYVFLNDVHGFYGNNVGSYRINISIASTDLDPKLNLREL